MSLAAGSTLGPYEILSLRGAGGMGEVYRARDKRLDRIVALKVLPPGLNKAEELRARFEREARAISSLSHPNICALFDVGREGGLEYLVMEWLEGETLAERLGRGPLPASLVVRYGAQIAEGLQHAHRAGMTHRDLKPGNVMITESGAKILDFGLAKFIEPSHRVFSDDSAPVTHRNPITAEGTIVGTMHYMSPEQVEGRPLDHRSDIFSLGVMLYEMATGQRPFRADSSAGLIASILASDPIPMRSLRPDIPPALERVVQAAVEKNPNDRWQTAQDVGRQLRWISETSMAGERVASPARGRIPSWTVVLAAALLSASLTWIVARTSAPVEAERARLDVQIVPPEDLSLRRFPEIDAFAVSPDGRLLVVVARGERGAGLYLRELSSPEFRFVDGTDGGVSPFWSSDSMWIGFTAQGKLWKTRARGESATEPICDVVAFGVRASWHGGTILFADPRSERREILRVPDTGGVPEAVTRIGDDEFTHSWPLILQDGTSFVYQSFGSGTMDRSLRLARLGDEEHVTLTKNVSGVRLLGPNRLAWVRDGVLVAQTVDLDARRLVGEPKILASDVGYFYPTGRADFHASPAGVVVYRTSTSTGRLLLMDRKGSVTRVVDATELFWDHALSPDGRKAAVTVVRRDNGLMDIWIYDLERGIRDRFTSDTGIEVSPTWTPDGRAIVFSQNQGGVFPHLVRKSLSGTTAEDLTPRDSFQLTASFAPDGDSFFFAADAGEGWDIRRLSLAKGKVEPVLATRFLEQHPAVSPDGAWLAYISTATGGAEVYLMSLREHEPVPIRISTEGGTSPRWRRDSAELFFVTRAGTVTSATPAGGGWDGARLAPLFRINGTMRGFDVAPDGQSFLVSDETEGSMDDLLHVIVGP